MSPLASSLTEMAKRATYTITEYEYGYSSRWPRNFLVAYLIIILAIIVLSGLGALVALIVWYFRERKRKQWYGPMAQYYRDRGFGRTGLVGYNGAMYVPQVVYVPFGGQQQPGAPQQPGPFVAGPMPGPGMIPYGQNPQFPYNPQFPQNPQVPQNMQNLPNQGQVMTPGNQPHPQLQPLNTSVNRSFGDVYGVNTGNAVASGSGSGNASGSGTTGDVAAGMSQRDIEGPISPIRDFNGAGAYDPFASPRVQAYPSPSHPPPANPSNLIPQAELSSSGAAHGITEVHAPVGGGSGGGGGGIQQMSEKGDVGLTRATNTLSFYSIPMGSHPNVAGGAAGPEKSS